MLREAFTGRGGIEVEMQGDSFHFAFADARAAVKAAGEAQRALTEARLGRRADPGADRHPSGVPLVSDRLYAGLDVRIELALQALK